jgi:hypothetical protein
LQKRIVRTLIHEVLADVDSEANEVVLVIHWRGAAPSRIESGFGAITSAAMSAASTGAVRRGNHLRFSLPHRPRPGTAVRGGGCLAAKSLDSS